jgi:anti-sigma factor RsiW
MKPCSGNRKRIAWLALGALSAQEASAIRAHIETCEGCRRYLAEMSQVTETLRTSGTAAEIEARDSFHQRLLHALRAGQPPRNTAAPLFRPLALNWRVVLPALGSATVAIILLATLVRHPGGSAPAPPVTRRAVASNSLRDLPPTLAIYQLAAGRSLEELDDLLARQASRHRSAPPLFTASTRGLD